MFKKLLLAFSALVLLGVLAVFSVLGLLRYEHTLPVTLPAPTGKFAVGRAMYDWVDSSRIDTFSPAQDEKRELTVWIWYPAAPSPSARTAEYMPAEWRKAMGNHLGAFMKNYLTRDYTKVTAHSLIDVDVSPAQPAYPVVLMRPGMGALMIDYTTLAEDLASHGYIVVGSDAPHSTFVVAYADGRVATRTPAGHPTEYLPEAEAERAMGGVIQVWTADVRFVLDQMEMLNTTGTFKGHLDLQSVGAFGHSFGGATAAQFCHDDARCKAGIDVDGRPFGSVAQESLTQPFHFLLSEHDSEPGSSEIMGSIKHICTSDRAGCRIATIRGARHFNFSDQALLKDRYLFRLARGLGAVGERRGLAIATANISAFFDVYLKHAPASALDAVATTYREIQIE